MLCPLMTIVHRRGVVIAIEGIDGAGKTTQAKRIVRRLRSLGYFTTYTSEPTNMRVGRIIKTELAKKSFNPYRQALLFAADRIEHVERVIKPFLEAGAIVVCDRYLHSSYAYQGALTGDMSWVREINKAVPPPDLAVLIDVSVPVAIQRKRRLKPFEDPSILERVRETYLKLCDEGLMVRVDGDREIEIVEADLFAAISSRLGLGPRSL
jgi:dTMP kinase